MKCLTVKQPWASLIAHGIKDVENRTWQTHYRGSLLIHAGSKTDTDALRHNPMVHEALELIGAADLSYPFSQILCRVELVDIVRDSESDWAISGHYHWILRNVQPIIDPAIRAGRLNLWDVPEYDPPQTALPRQLALHLT